ncbi:uncharacterized protein [Drosophila virilis]|uniref:DUF7775 domain-containing protein n=1 Tax=Drosophila virilis TaxID=7244 RepID=B4LW60_DROVI|nr:uncharacterized protein LOC6629479 [Drosophila virilis]EDW67594.1 uncharacterized protein Dvir_GJ24234 [Drosophila virilis]
MWDAERDFHLMYTGKEPVEGVYEKDNPVHQFAFYLLFQSIASLACGVLYMLHATILIDIKITAAHQGLTDGANSVFVPIDIYVLGEYVQTRLEDYEWFHAFCSDERIDI